MFSFTYILIVLVALVIFASFFTVKQQSAAVLERFGKFNAIRQSGLRFKIPLIDRIAGKLSLKIQQLDVIIETKTKDASQPKIVLSTPLSVRIFKDDPACSKRAQKINENNIKIPTTIILSLSSGEHFDNE